MSRRRLWERKESVRGAIKHWRQGDRKVSTAKPDFDARPRPAPHCPNVKHTLTACSPASSTCSSARCVARAQPSQRTEQGQPGRCSAPLHGSQEPPADLARLSQTTTWPQHTGRRGIQERRGDDRPTPALGLFISRAEANSSQEQHPLYPARPTSITSDGACVRIPSLDVTVSPLVNIPGYKPPVTPTLHSLPFSLYFTIDPLLPLLSGTGTT